MIVAAHVYVWILKCYLCRSVRLDREIIRVARVWMWIRWIVDSMMRIIWVEVAPGTGETREFTLRVLMHVERVLPRMKILQVQLNSYALAALLLADRRRADALPLGVL